MSVLSVLVVAAIGYWFYASSLRASSASGSPTEAISTVGVKSDLLSIAQAERIYQATHGSYASLNELYSSGALTVRKSDRAGYTYSSETSLEGFTITARCQTPPSVACPSFSIDQTMQVQQLP